MHMDIPERKERTIYRNIPLHIYTFAPSKCRPLGRHM